MEFSMLKSHNIMSTIYNCSTHRKDYNFESFERNRLLLKSLLENAASAELNLIVFHHKGEFVFYLLEDDSNFVDTTRNVLFSITLTKNMIDSKEVMNHLSSLLNQIDLKIQTNEILQSEAIAYSSHQDDSEPKTNSDESDYQMGELAIAEEMRQENLYERDTELPLW